MALEDLVQRIKDDASAERERLLEGAKKEAAAMLSEGKSGFDEKKNARTAAMKAEEERISRSVRVTTSMKLRSFELAQRRETMDLVRERTLGALEALDDAAYQTLLEKRIAQLPGDEGELMAAKGKKAVTAAAAKAAGKGYDVKEEDDALAGGFRFTSGDLTVEAGFESLLDEYLADNEAVVAKRLFETETA